jgi:hypothetical protein
VGIVDGTTSPPRDGAVKMDVEGKEEPMKPTKKMIDVKVVSATMIRVTMSNSERSSRNLGAKGGRKTRERSDDRGRAEDKCHERALPH